MAKSSKVVAVALGVIVIIITTGFALYYSQTTNSIQVMSSSISSQQQAISSLSSQVASIQEHTVTLTQTSFVTSTMTHTVTLTQTSFVTSTITLTTISVVYPIPNNVTVSFTNISGPGAFGYNYAITLGSSPSLQGSSMLPLTIPLTNLIQGESVDITASLAPSEGTCLIGQTVTAQLFLNGEIVAQSTTQCSSTESSPIQINYNV